MRCPFRRPCPARAPAHLHRAHTEIADAVGLPLAQENRVGLQLDVEPELARVAQELEEILAEGQLAAAEDQKARSRGRQLIQHALTSAVPDYIRAR